MNNDNKNAIIDDYNQVIDWFINEFKFENATNVNLNFDNINDFDFTVSFLVDNYFNCKINYISGRNSFLLDIYDTRYNETILHYLTYFDECKSMCDALTHGLIVIAKLIENGAY